MRDNFTENSLVFHRRSNQPTNRFCAESLIVIEASGILPQATFPQKRISGSSGARGSHLLLMTIKMKPTPRTPVFLANLHNFIQSVFIRETCWYRCVLVNRNVYIDSYRITESLYLYRRGFPSLELVNLTVDRTIRF